MLFTSQAQLTSYDNAKNDELYLYEALSGRLVCVSCNPDGVPATNEAYLANNQELSIQPGPRAFLRATSPKTGSRVFFQTKEALVPQDTNEQTDVYEWEREGAGGADGCTRLSATFSASSGGCLYLISTGESASPSYFGDASASGNNVFFFTRQALVDQDQDENYDVYDARVEGGIAAQNPPPLGGLHGGRLSRSSRLLACVCGAIQRYVCGGWQPRSCAEGRSEATDARTAARACAEDM